MRSESPDQAEQGGVGGGKSGVKRRPLHHHQQQQQQQQSQRQSPLLLPHHASSCSDGSGDKKRSTSALERRMVFFRRLFQQSSVSSSSFKARLLAWPILITFMLVPIVIFHALQSSSSSSSSSFSSWPFGAGLAKSRWMTIRRTIIEPQSLYGRHARTVEHDAAVVQEEATGSGESHDVTRLAIAKENIDKNIPLSLSTTSTTTKQKQQQQRLVKPMISRHAREELQDSSAYQDAQPDKFETKHCKAQFEWQKTAYMTCNLHHELDMTILLLMKNVNNNNNNSNSNDQQQHADTTDETLRLVANGYYRDVWVTNDYYHDATNLPARGSRNTTTTSNNKIVLKTLRYEHAFDLRNWDRHRRDAIVMERLSSSPFVLDIYASCGNSGLTEYAPGGSIKNAIFSKRPSPKQPPKQWQMEQQQQVAPKEPSKMKRLQMAVQATMGLQALHSVGLGTEGSFGPAIAHTDISPDQFVRVGDIYKLNDFNRARFIRVDPKRGKLCPFKISQASGFFRSPEEYDKGYLTEMIDIYSLGNLFYILLTDQWPWDDVGSSSDSERATKKRIMHGERPAIPVAIANSTHPVDQVLHKAMVMCQLQDPTERATAAQVAALLQETLKKVDPGRLEQWGVVI